MKRKEVEDVIGGKDSWENVDRADGESMISISYYVLLSLWVGGWVGRGGMEWDGDRSF